MHKLYLLEDWKSPTNGDEVKKGQILTLGDDRVDEVKELLLTQKARHADEQDLNPPEDPDVPTPDAVKKMVADAMKAAIEEAAKGTKADPPVLQEPAGATKVYERVLDDPKMGYKSLGFFMRDVMFAGRKGAPRPEGLKIWDSIHKARTEADIIKAYAGDGVEKAVTGMSEGVDSDGGFIPPIEFRTRILEKTYAETSVINPAGGASVMEIPMLASAVEIPYIDETSRIAGSRAGGIGATRTPEGGQLQKTKPRIGKLALKLKKLMAGAAMTAELVEDAPGVAEALLMRVMTRELAFVINDEVLNGWGATMMLGLLNSSCLVTVSEETNQDAATIKFENVLKMWARLYGPLRQGSVWFINQDTLPQLMSMEHKVGTGGTSAYLPPGGLNDKPYGFLFGRPVIEIEQCKTLGTLGDICLVNMGEYVYATKGDVKFARSIHLRFDYDEEVFKFTMRNDGAPWWASALTPASGSANTLSPFVALETRSG